MKRLTKKDSSATADKAKGAAPEQPVADDVSAPDELVPAAIFEAHGKKTVTLLRCDVDGHESVENPCPVCGTDKEL